ncbi:MAG: septum formation initiator family protein [Bdellovibrio sp.]|nr:MAG: septum formation initiator family protein [Bdellovibrio sp.]
MIGQLFKPFFVFLNKLLHQPLKVLFICLAVLFFSLIIQGHLFQLWRLHQSAQKLQQTIKTVRHQTHVLENKVKNASGLHFIEMEARERYDLVRKGDLVFVFPNEEENQGGDHE